MGTVLGGLGSKVLPLQNASETPWLRTYLETGELPPLTGTRQAVLGAGLLTRPVTEAILAKPTPSDEQTKKP
jgi:hypothetical protein